MLNAARYIQNKSKHTGNLLTALLVCLLAISCEKSPQGQHDEHSIPDSTSGAMLICNEGNFGWGNAALSYYHPNGTLVSDVYKTANGKSVGDVLQSASIINNKLYLVVNNSSRIDILDPKTFKVSGSIGGFTSPRYLITANNETAYVSDLYANGVYIINLNTNTITGKITINGWTEGMALLGQTLWVCARGSRYVYRINTSNNTITDSLETGYGPACVVKDKSQRVWVLTYGSETEKAHLLQYTAAGHLVQSLDFTLNQHPTRLTINSTADTLYWINTDVYAMDVRAASMPVTPLIAAAGHNFYSISCYNKAGTLLVSDVKDFVQKSEIMQYTRNGTYLGSFKAGIISGSFCEIP